MAPCGVECVNLLTNAIKTLGMKIIHLALVTNIPTAAMELLSKIQKEFLWRTNKYKIKHETLCNDYENGGLKRVGIFSEIAYNVLGSEDYVMKTFIPKKLYFYI